MHNFFGAAIENRSFFLAGRTSRMFDSIIHEIIAESEFLLARLKSTSLASVHSALG